MNRRLDLALLVLALAGVAAVVAGVVGAAGEDQRAFALPFVASGVFGGLAVIVFALGVLWLQAHRRAALAAHHQRIAEFRRASGDES